MQQQTIVVTGFAGSGKTQCIESVSEFYDFDEIELPSTSADRPALAIIDYGNATLDNGTQLLLYGLPPYQLPLLDDLRASCRGCLILIDSTNPHPKSLQLAERMLALYNKPTLILATKPDQHGALPVEELRRRLNIPAQLPILSCDVSDEQAAKAALKRLLGTAQAPARPQRPALEFEPAPNAHRAEPPDPTRLELYAALDDIFSNAGASVVGAALVSAGGQLLALKLLDGGIGGRIATLAPEVVDFAQRIVGDLQLGTPAETIICADEGYLLVAPIGTAAVLALRLRAHANLGMVRIEARQAARRIIRTLTRAQAAA